MKIFRAMIPVLVAAFVGASSSIHADDIDDAIKVIKNVEKFGKGNKGAVGAMQTLNRAKPSDVPRLLDAINGSNPLAKNWLRSAIETSLENSEENPAAEIKSYFQDKGNDSLGRVLAFELLTDGKPDLAKEMIPSLIQDPSLPLRRLGIAHFIELAKSTEDKDKATKIMLEMLQHARDVDQVNAIVDHLATLDMKIDLAKQLGFITEWKMIGVYDNSEEKGFAASYKPEAILTKLPDPSNSIEIEKEFPDKTIKTHVTTESTGMVDVNAIYGNEKNAIIYATAIFNSDRDQEVDIRIGCINAHKVWINEQLIIDNEIYHVGMQPDQFVGKAQLKKGANRIVYKVCQNDDKAAWAQNWRFQLRVCDETGKAILSTDRK